MLIHPDLPVEWANLPDSPYYYIELERVEIGNETLKVFPTEAIIDSGTTFT